MTSSCIQHGQRLGLILFILCLLYVGESPAGESQSISEAKNTTVPDWTSGWKSLRWNNNNNNLFIYSALFNILGDQKRITTINNLKTIQILEIYKYI